MKHLGGQRIHDGATTSSSSKSLSRIAVPQSRQLPPKPRERAKSCTVQGGHLSQPRRADKEYGPALEPGKTDGAWGLSRRARMAADPLDLLPG